MRHMMPLMLAAPSLLQGALAIRARRAKAEESRRAKVGVIFNLCYLVLVAGVFMYVGA